MKKCVGLVFLVVLLVCAVTMMGYAGEHESEVAPPDGTGNVFSNIGNVIANTVTLGQARAGYSEEQKEQVEQEKQMKK